MKLKFIITAAVLAILSACMSTSPQLGADASAWDNYLSWYKVTPEATTGDPTGFLGGVHASASYPYPEGTILLKESFSNEAALDARRNVELTVMIKLAAGQSPATGDWEYVRPDDARGTGDSGLATFCRDCHLFAAATDYNFINSVFFQNNR